MDEETVEEIFKRLRSIVSIFAFDRLPELGKCLAALLHINWHVVGGFLRFVRRHPGEFVGGQKENGHQGTIKNDDHRPAPEPSNLKKAHPGTEEIGQNSGQGKRKKNL